MSIGNVLSGAKRWHVEAADCIAFMDNLSEDCVSLVFGSPPYCDARTYGIDAVYDCQQWVEWMLGVTETAVRISNGLVCWVASGVQRDNCYWPACEGLMWEWWKKGNQLWCPAVWWKVDEDEGGTGIPGSGGNVPGKRYLRKDWEYVLVFKKKGNIPYDHPEVMGHEPLYSRLGGEMSNRTADGQRINRRTGKGVKARREKWAAVGAKGQNGEQKVTDERRPPKIVNPGNVIRVKEDRLIVKARVGGGHIGSALAHENEAPFPEQLATFFIRSFAGPGSIVLDCFSGSGTTVAVAVREGRRGLGCDIREAQVELARRRVSEETPTMFPEG